MKCSFVNPKYPKQKCPDEALPGSHLCGHHTLVATYVSELIGNELFNNNNPAVFMSALCQYKLI